MAGLIKSVIKLYFYTIVIATGLLFLFLPLSVPVLSSSQDFSIYNSSWNGCSRLAVTTYRMGGLIPSFTISGSTSDLRVVNLPPEKWNLDSKKDSVVIIGPDRPFTYSQGRILRDYILNGGIILLADDFGEGNTLLSYLGTSTRITGKLALDLSFSKKGEFMMVSDIGTSPITENVSFLLLNYPSTLSISNNATPIAFSSPTSWLEIIRNEKLDDIEPSGPFPLIALERIGKGFLLTLSDPSILINQMLSKADNMIFADNIVKYITHGGRNVIFDEYHRRYTNPIAFSDTVIHTTSWYGGSLLPILIFLIGAIYITDVYRKPFPRILSFLERFLGGEDKKEEKRKPIDEFRKMFPEEVKEGERILYELEEELSERKNKVKNLT